jgi:hypothetical protein
MFGEIEEENFQAPLGECEILKVGLHDNRCKELPFPPCLCTLGVYAHHVLAVAIKPAVVFAMGSGGFHPCY